MKELNTKDMNAMDTFSTVNNEKGGIVIPVILWWLGAPLALVIVLWLLFFR